MAISKLYVMNFFFHLFRCVLWEGVKLYVHMSKFVFFQLLYFLISVPVAFEIKIRPSSDTPDEIFGGFDFLIFK